MSRESSQYEFFWSGPFSQWRRTEFNLDGVTFNTAEQAMMYFKARLFGDEGAAEKILRTRDPREQKALGRQVRNFDTAKWDQHKEEIVLRANRAKFGQNEDLRRNLFQTGDRKLVEASPFDKVWGIGLREADARTTQEEDWPGKNLLGKILTQVREELVYERPNEAKAVRGATATSVTATEFHEDEEQGESATPTLSSLALLVEKGRTMADENDPNTERPLRRSTRHTRPTEKRAAAEHEEQRSARRQRTARNAPAQSGRAAVQAESSRAAGSARQAEAAGSVEAGASSHAEVHEEQRPARRQRTVRNAPTRSGGATAQAESSRARESARAAVAGPAQDGSAIAYPPADDHAETSARMDRLEATLARIAAAIEARNTRENVSRDENATAQNAGDMNARLDRLEAGLNTLNETVRAGVGRPADEHAQTAAGPSIVTEPSAAVAGTFVASVQAPPSSSAEPPRPARTYPVPDDGQYRKFEVDGRPLESGRAYWSNDITRLDKQKMQDGHIDVPDAYRNGMRWNVEAQENILQPGADRRPFAHVLPDGVPVSREQSLEAEPARYPEKVYYMIPKNNWEEARRLGAVLEKQRRNEGWRRTPGLENTPQLHYVEGQNADRAKFKSYPQVNIETGEILRPDVTVSQRRDERLTARRQGAGR